ncbi:hypothetical protein ES703_67095 [subsurface metagenome]
MPKLKTPLLSLDARGSLAKLFAFTKRRGQHIVEAMPTPTDAKSPNQLFYRHMFTKCADLWHTLSEAEKQAWEQVARPKHMTGYAFWISSCLRPNPGIYLPLQGGTMQGLIQMDGHHIHGLPLPIHVQDPIRRQDYHDYIEPYLYNEGARAYHDANQSIPTATWTILSLNSELRDTDNIHDNITNNHRLTCRTAGVYQVTLQAEFWNNPTGYRTLRINDNVHPAIAEVKLDASGSIHTTFITSTQIKLAVNDYVIPYVYQTSGVALNVMSIPHYSPVFSMQRIGK